jgi:muramoyltetrapeptide carboxypeptidase
METQALGFSVKFGAHFNSTYGYLAGTDPERASDVNNMFADGSVAGIMADRGGWGCARILPLLDYESIRAHAKPFIGYSDITACLMAIHVKTDMVVFHGPMGVSDWSVGSLDQQAAQDILQRGGASVIRNPPAYPTWTINAGRATGKLIGGNLSVLAGIIGSEYVPTDWSEYVLFLEDVGEAPYRIDRMLTELQLAGILEQVAGFVWGTCTNCDDGTSFNVSQVLQQHLQPLGVPAFSGLRFGHISEQLTLPIGVRVHLDANEGTLTMLESAVAKQ